MSHYWDQLTREVSTASREAADEAEFLRRAHEVEERAVRDVNALLALPAFPNDLAERISRRIAEHRNDPEARDYLAVTHSSRFLSDLHSLFHEVARRAGYFSDDPAGTMRRHEAELRDRHEEVLVESKRKLVEALAELFEEIVRLVEVNPAAREDQSIVAAIEAIHVTWMSLKGKEPR